jgi:hypothetical protein
MPRIASRVPQCTSMRVPLERPCEVRNLRDPFDAMFLFSKLFSACEVPSKYLALAIFACILQSYIIT